MSARDYNLEFQRFAARFIPDSDYVLAVVADRVVKVLAAEDPDLLDGWLRLNAANFVTQFLGDQDRAARNRRNAESPRRAFSSAAKEFAAGDATGLGRIRSLFDERFVVNQDNVRRRLGDMTAADHLFVAGEHTRRANTAKLEAAFHRAIAKRIPEGQTTKDVLDEEEYERMRLSIYRVGQKTTAA